jgi:phosphoglycolate phosphatase-like HAD superfamily hydrolase
LPRLVLFDIDGTLLHTSGAGVRGMTKAFAVLYGRDHALEGLPIAGRTDRAIVSDAMRNIGVDPTDAEMGRLRDAYIEGLPGELANPVPGKPHHVIPGAADLLTALEGESDAITALLTGNFLKGAIAKLGHFGIWDRFAFGAFGDDHLDRRDLVPIGLTRANEAGHGVVPPRHAIVIGDTPSDIDCARAHGARSIGVTTGPFDRAALEAAGADLVVDSLGEVDAVLTVIRSD